MQATLVNMANPSYMKAMLDFIYADTYDISELRQWQNLNGESDLHLWQYGNLNEAFFHAMMVLVGYKYRVYGLPAFAIKQFDSALALEVKQGSFANAPHLTSFIRKIYHEMKPHQGLLRKHLLAFIRCELDSIMRNNVFWATFDRIDGLAKDIIVLMRSPDASVFCTAPGCKTITVHRSLGLKCPKCEDTL